MVARGAHRAVDHGEVDAFGDDRVALGVRGDVDADELSHVALQLRSGEQHRVRGVRCQVRHEPGTEPEVLAQVDLAEVLAGQRARTVERPDDGVRVGCDREHRRDAELARDIGGGETAHIGHAQVQQVDRSGGAQNATDAAPRGDPQRPGRGRGHGLRQQRHPAVHVPRGRGADLEQVLGGLGDRPTRERDHTLDSGARIRDERITETDEQSGDAAVVARSDGGE